MTYDKKINDKGDDIKLILKDNLVLNDVKFLINLSMKDERLLIKKD